jgi:hypothetical protein
MTRMPAWPVLAAVPVSAVLVLASAAPASAHSSLVTITCQVDPDNHATDIVITNGQTMGTGWMHGYKETATTLVGATITRTNSTIPFRLRPHAHLGWVEGFQPKRIAKCAAHILWGT